MKLFTLPNLMTCCNLFCGCFGITLAYEVNLLGAAYCIFLAVVFDFLDGFVARLTNSASPIGKELDSLADVVTFGVLPSIMVYRLCQETMIGDLSYIALFLAIFSALRLAKFNIDTRQTNSFIGVPTPANALVVASFPLIITFQEEYKHLVLNSDFLIGYTVVMSALLIAEIPLFSLKFKQFGWKANQIQYIFLILSGLLVLCFRFAAIPLIITLYIVLSFFSNKHQNQ